MTAAATFPLTVAPLVTNYVIDWSRTVALVCDIDQDGSKFMGQQSLVKEAGVLSTASGQFYTQSEASLY